MAGDAVCLSNVKTAQTIDPNIHIRGVATALARTIKKVHLNPQTERADAQLFLTNVGKVPPAHDRALAPTDSKKKHLAPPGALDGGKELTGASPKLTQLMMLIHQ